MRIANAPCSWGTLEFDGLEGEQIGYGQMLDELTETGYEGTELGDWGYMPTDVYALSTELARRRISMRGAFVPIALSRAEELESGIRRALRTARLLADVAEPADPPVLVLADENARDPVRTANAGRITSAMGLSNANWMTLAQGANAVAAAVRQETGLATVFHHHCAGFVETPAEIRRFLALTDPDLVSLVFDTGHYAYGAGDCAVVVEAMEELFDRIEYVHFKDCHPGVAEMAGREAWDYFTAVGSGLFCELGDGGIDFPAVVSFLRSRGYDGWAVVEQDVLPGMGSPRESAARNRAYLRRLGI